MSKEIESNQLTMFALALAEAAAGQILPWFRRNAPIDVKDGPAWDPVTEGDRAGERIMRGMIEERYPDHGIHGEEYGIKQAQCAFTWLLDPIDGTRAFICGMPTWSTLIGLNLDGKPVVGVMNQPFVGDMFYGNPNGAWLNHRGQVHPLKTRTGTCLKHAAAGTTAPELYRSERQRLAFDRLQSAVQMTRFGGDAYFYALVAAGHLDIAMDANLEAYDIAPLLPIVTGAGGAVAEWHGGNPAHGGNVITAGSQALLDEALAVLA